MVIFECHFFCLPMRLLLMLSHSAANEKLDNNPLMILYRATPMVCYQEQILKD